MPEQNATVTALVAALAVLAAAGGARADGTVTVRGVYYKERATRVVQPMVDAALDAGSHGTVTGHFLVDAITSASASSGADEGTPFTERRYEGGLGYRHELGDLTLGGDARYSTESDYRSIYGGVNGALALAQKNTVLALGAGLSLDQVSAAAAQGPSMPTLRCSAAQPAETRCGLDVYALTASVSQLVSPDAVVALSLDLATLRGYQSNPYRTAIVGEALVTERHPDQRDRGAITASARYYVAASGTTLIASYRYYRDSWEVHAHTPELRLVQDWGDSVDVGLRVRYYRQDGAYFYKRRYPADDPAMTQPVTDDAKLSDFTGHTIEAKLGVLGRLFHLEDRWARARFEAIFEYVAQHNAFGTAIIAHAALSVPLGD